MEFDDTIVLFTGAELRRNVSGFPFSRQLEGEERDSLEKLIRRGISLLGDLVGVNSLGARQLRDLRNRRILGPATGPGASFMEPSEDPSRWVVSNSNEHLHLFSRVPGVNLQRVYGLVREWDLLLEKQLSYAFSFEMGYLLSRLDETGTGFFLEALLFLPGISREEEDSSLFRLIMEKGFEIETFTGGSEAGAEGLFFLRNSMDLGMDEEEQMKIFAQLLNLIVHYERKARRKVIEQDGPLWRDRVFRSWGLLSTAELLSWDEGLQLVLSLYLGVYFGLVPVDAKLLYKTLWEEGSSAPEGVQGTSEQQWWVDTLRKSLGIARLIGGEHV